MGENVTVKALKNLGLSVREKGTNVSVGYVGLDCPRCGDRNKHLGVNLETLRCSCWRCGPHGHLYKVLIDLFGIPWSDIKAAFTAERKELIEAKSALDQIREIVKTYEEPEEDVEKKNFTKESIGLVRWITPDYQDVLLNKFLERRGFTLADCLEWGLGVSYHGPLAYRLIFPIYRYNPYTAYINVMMLGCTGRALQETMEPKYKSMGNINETLYKAPLCHGQRPLLIVEGVFDHWRIANHVELFGTAVDVVASFGKRLSGQQIQLLSEIKPSEVFIVWDSDAFLDAVAARDEVRATGIDCLAIALPEGEDPDSLGAEGVKKLLEEAKEQKTFGSF